MEKSWDGIERRRDDFRHQQNLDRFKEIKDSTDSILKIMNGNGHKGLISRLYSVESDMKFIQENMKDHSDKNEQDKAFLFRNLYIAMGGLGVIVFILNNIRNH